MPITFNGVSLPVGTKQYWGSTEIRDIVFNGVNVWHYDSAGPVITFTSSSATTTTRAYTLKGRVIDADSGISSVKINGTSVSLDSSGYFSVNYNLSNGSNTFTVVATDTAGNSSTNALSIIYVNPSEDYGTNVEYTGGANVIGSGNLYRKWETKGHNSDSDFHASAWGVIHADFYHQLGANWMNVVVKPRSGGDNHGSYAVQLMTTSGAILKDTENPNCGSDESITVDTSPWANRTDIFLRVIVRSENGGWPAKYSDYGYSVEVSMSPCTQGV